MKISSPASGYAEQAPEMWWENLVNATRLLLAQAGVSGQDIKAVGISYQMHGLVCVDFAGSVLRPSIIWCDSRAVPYGEKAQQIIGAGNCLSSLMNLPGNFTAAKLAWVKENEPEIFSRIHKILLPGDYIAMKLSGALTTTFSGLSEGMFWNFKSAGVSKEIMSAFGFSSELLPEAYSSFEPSCSVSREAAELLGIKSGIPISYRAGDQPNNAFSLNVIRAGETAATAGTSGVVYGVLGEPACDEKSRVNIFCNVTYTAENPSVGALLCVNGMGILNSWLKNNIASGLSYSEMNDAAAGVIAGSEGLYVLPYGNGAERSLENKNLGASFHNLDLIRHGFAHILRAGQEGAAFALNYGIAVLKQIGLPLEVIKAGRANMFLSPVFAQTLADAAGASIELYDTDGSLGAARGAAVGAGLYSGLDEAFESFERLAVIEPGDDAEAVRRAYADWEAILAKAIG
jgi:xylulokinase